MTDARRDTLVLALDADTVGRLQGPHEAGRARTAPEARG
jgi:hypothetical protein